MKAWQFMGEGKPIQLNEVSEPVPGPNDVVIDNKAAGLCHTDIGILEGSLAELVPHTPITLGHEFAGEVIEVGENVKSISVGDRVAGGMAIDVPGVGSDGGYAKKVLIPEHLVVPIPDGVNFIEAAAGSDAGTTAHFGVHGAGKVKPGEKVGIIGIGGVGSIGAKIAMIAGAEVYVAELKEELHEKALSWGVKSCVKDASDLDQFECDVIIDYAGFGVTTSKAVEAVKPYGRVVIVGMGASETTINTTLMITKHLTVIGSGADQSDSVTKVYELIESGQLDIDTTTINFDEIGEGLEALSQGKVEGRLVAVID